MKQEIVLIWITFLSSAYPDKILTYKAAEIYMELKGRAVWRKAHSLIFNHSSLPYITDTNKLILTYTIKQKYKNG